MKFRLACMTAAVLVFVVAGCGQKGTPGVAYGDPKKWDSPKIPYQAVTSISVSPNGKLLAAASFGGGLSVYDVATTLPLKTFKRFEGENRLMQVEFIDDDTLLVAGESGWLKAVEPVSGKVQYTIEYPGANFMPFALDRDKKRLACIEDDEKIYIWSLEDRKLIKSFPGPGDGVQDIVFTPGGNYVFTSTNGGNEVAQWNIQTGKKVWSRRAETFSIALAPNGKYLAFRCDNAIEIWDLATNSRYKQLAPIEFGIGHYSFTFSPDGKLLAGGELGGDLVIWDVASGGELADYDGPVGDGLEVEFSPDGKKIFVCGFRDSTVRMWYVPTMAVPKIKTDGD